MAKRYPDYVQNQVPLYYMREELREKMQNIRPERNMRHSASVMRSVSSKKAKRSHEPDGMAKECIFGFFLRRW